MVSLSGDFSDVATFVFYIMVFWSSFVMVDACCAFSSIFFSVFLELQNRKISL